MPEVRQPQREVSFKQKFLWTMLALVIYMVMSNIPLYGVPVEQTQDYFYWLRVILASKRGMLTELGIGPIVTAGLIMQLLNGSKMIDVDMANPYDRALFSGAQKALAMILTLFNAVAYLFGGAFGDINTIPLIDAFFILLQLFIAGLIIILLDELLQKGWGLGSGVSLFIAAGVAGEVFWNAFNFTERTKGIPQGIAIAFFSVIFDGNPNTTIGDIFVRNQLPDLLGAITTLVIFLVVIWFESTRIEIPLQYKGYSGFKGTYPIKLLYVSNIPVILVNALYANFLFIGQIIAGPNSIFRDPMAPFNLIDIVGTFTQQGGRLTPTGGLIYLLTPPQSIAQLVADPIRALIYLAIFIVLCVYLGRVWVEVSGLAPRDVADQILDSGMQIPGFRSSSKVIKGILKRYIPTLIILNGIIIAVLSFLADSLGALTSGTGLLIAIGITHQYAETISKEFAAMQYPGMRGMLGLD